MSANLNGSQRVYIVSENNPDVCFFSTCSQAQPACSEAQRHAAEGGRPRQVPTHAGAEDAQQTALQDFPHTHKWKGGKHTDTHTQSL